MPKIGRCVAVMAIGIALLTATIAAFAALTAMASIIRRRPARAPRRCANAQAANAGSSALCIAPATAMSVDAKNPCGSFGWAIDSHLGKAENISVRRCAEYGGHDCVIRAWACDEKG
ncbi:MAG: DUF4189 domain-containing protein [Xanthobacteraceae bacterium]